MNNYYISKIFILILTICLIQITPNINSIPYLNLGISSVEASPFKIISGVISAYHRWKRSKNIKQTTNHLRSKCEQLAETYQKFKGSLQCLNKCGGLKKGEERSNCFNLLIRKIDINLEIIRSELDSRIAFQNYCAKTQVGRKKTSSEQRDGEKWSDDEGHQIRINELNNQIKKCRSVASSAVRELAKEFETNFSNKSFIKNYELQSR